MPSTSKMHPTAGPWAGTVGIKGFIAKCSACEGIFSFWEGSEEYTASWGVGFIIKNGRAHFLKGFQGVAKFLCKKCQWTTAKRIRYINKLGLKKLPLYISDSNIFVREFAINKIKEMT